jgi:hypothetical protein
VAKVTQQAIKAAFLTVFRILTDVAGDDLAKAFAAAKGRLSPAFFLG